MTNATDNLIDRLKTELGRDKKKAAILAVLVLVAVGFVAKTLLKGPKNAAASPSLAMPPVATLAQPGGSGSSPVTPAAARVTRDVSSYLRQIDRNINRDIFRVSADLFPPDTTAVARIVRTPDNSEGWFEQLDSMLSGQEQALRAQEDRTNSIRAQAQALSLQSIMLGNAPTALINGQVLRPGEWVNGFRVESVATGRCVVSKDNVLVELKMKN